MTGKTIVSDIIQLLEDLWQDGYSVGKNAGYRDGKKEWKK